MPIYGYRCAQCSHVVEALQKFSDPPLTVCPQCQGVLEKQMYPAGVVFKGSGYYTTDYRSNGRSESRSESGSEGGSGGDSKSGSASDSGSKSETGGKGDGGSNAAPAAKGDGGASKSGGKATPKPASASG